MKRMGIVSLFTAAIFFALPAAGALAHVCFVANDGKATTGNSQRWFTFSLEQAYSEFFGLSGDDLEEAMELSEEAGLPTSFKTRTDRELLADTGAQAMGRTGDGRGIEWFSESPLVGQLIQIAITASS